MLTSSGHGNFINIYWDSVYVATGSHEKNILKSEPYLLSWETESNICKNKQNKQQQQNNNNKTKQNTVLFY